MVSQGLVTSIQTCEASPSETCIGCLVSMQRTFVGCATHETGQTDRDTYALLLLWCAFAGPARGARNISEAPACVTPSLERAAYLCPRP